MLKYLTEFLGTFFFLAVILMATKEKSQLNNIAPLAIGLALITVIYFGGNISGGHFNPAVSIMMVVNKSLPLCDLLPYIIAQVLGGLAAYKCVQLASTYF